jgi:serine phosphatase RsbU (regulator of sigma subunit)
MSKDGDAQQWDRVASTLLDVEAPSLATLAGVVATAVGATDCRLLIADYSLRFLRPLESDGSVGEIIPVEGTMAGRCFASGEQVSNGDSSPTTWLPLNDSAERIGVAELRFANPVRSGLDTNRLMDLLVLAIVSRRRYTDVIHRARRTRPLSEAAEAQWDLLPPLTHSVAGAAVAGALEPAYSIGGDSFDYAFNPGTLDFAVLDAAGHGLDAVLMCAAAVHSLRNARRSNRSLAETYAQIDRRIRLQFGNSYFVTGQLCSLDVTDGTLTWINAGHVLPLHVRDRTLIGEIECLASLPMGLGGDVREVARIQLQPGDRLLFYTDGVTESRSADGDTFGVDRLADYLVRATIDAVPVAETVRRLTTNVVDHVGGRLRDDATVFLVDYSG